jgi:hypothetical protein
VRPWRATLTIIAVASIAGCAAPVVERRRDVAGAAEPGDKVVFLSLDSPDDGSIPRCVAHSVEAARPDLTVMPPKQFRNALFPRLEEGTAPHDLEGFGLLLAERAVSQRLAELRLRYVAVVSGNTTMERFRGEIVCGAFGGYGGGGAGCFGLKWAARESRIATALWDTKATGRATLSTEVKGTWIIPALILPIPLLRPTEWAACEAMAQQILDHLSGPLGAE